MKKTAVFILTTVYLLSAIGVSASSFYCCGILKSTTFSIGEVQSTAARSITKADDCCKTTKQSFKVKDNHYGPDLFSLSAKFFPIIIPATAFQFGSRHFAPVYTVFNSHAPPFSRQGPIYILNCTYLI